MDYLWILGSVLVYVVVLFLGSLLVRWYGFLYSKYSYLDDVYSCSDKLFVRKSDHVLFFDLLFIPVFNVLVFAVLVFNVLEVYLVLVFKSVKVFVYVESLVRRVYDVFKRVSGV